VRAYARPDDKGPPLAVISTADDQHPELTLFTHGPGPRTSQQDIQEAGLSGLQTFASFGHSTYSVLGTGKTITRARQLLTADASS